MNSQIFAWDRSRSQLESENRWREVVTLIGLFLAAIILCCLNLNHPPLSENEVIALKSLNFAYLAEMSSENPWLVRFPSSVLTALSVPLLYSLAKENYRFWLPSFLSAVIYLTTLPVIIYGRLAHFDGLILLLSITLFWSGLRSRRDLRWSLMVGLSSAILILLNQWVALLLILSLFIFFCWDTPRLMTSGYFWMGSMLGSLLPLGIYFGLTGNYQLERIFSLTLFSEIHLISLRFFLISWLKLLIFSLPWLIFVKDGFQLAWNERHWSWGKLVIAWGSFTLLGAGFNPFSSSFESWLSVYPVFALVGGMILGRLSATDQELGDRRYSSIWSFSLFILAIITFMVGLGLYFELFTFFPNLEAFSNQKQTILLIIALILTSTVSGILILRKNIQFIAILAWGMYVSLMIWLSSPHWTILI